MGFLDSLSGIFNSGAPTAAASASPNPWMVGASILGGILSQRRATPNPGASRGDIERANRFNLIASLLGGGLQAYGQYNLANDAQQQRQNALAGLMDIYSKGGMQQQGPMPDGSIMPKLGLTQSLMQYGAQNPAIQDDVLKLGLQSMTADREQERWDAQRAMQQSQFDATLGLQRDQLTASAQHNRAMEGIAAMNARASAANAQAAAGARQQQAMLGMLEGADPMLKARILAGQTTEPNPNYVPESAPRIPGISSPEVLSGEAQQQPPSVSLLQKALSQSTERADMERQRPYINDALQRLDTVDQHKGYTNAIKQFEVVDNLLKGDRFQQEQALKIITSMADNTAAMQGEMDTSFRGLMSNANRSLDEAKSWLGNKADLTPAQRTALLQTAGIYAGGAQNALRNRMRAEESQLSQFGVPSGRLILFNPYLERQFPNVGDGVVEPIAAAQMPSAQLPSIQGLTPGMQFGGGIFTGRMR